MRWLPSARRNPGKAGCQRLCWVLTNAFPTIYERSPMTDDKPVPTDSSSQQKHALSQWDTEGGAGPCGPQDSSNPIEGLAAIPELTNAELVPASHSRYRLGEPGDHAARRGVGTTTRTLSRNGSFYIAKTRLHSSSSHDPRCCSNDQLGRARRSLAARAAWAQRRRSA
jgi:hypothetical protein